MWYHSPWGNSKKFQEMWNIVIFRPFFFLEQLLEHVICCVEFRALCFAETHRYILCCYALFEIGLHDRVLMFGAHCCLGNMSHKAAFRQDFVRWKCCDPHYRFFQICYDVLETTQSFSKV